MRIITERRVRSWAERNPKAASSLLAWLETVKQAEWHTLAEVRKTYAHADGVTVASGRTVTVFNIAGNDSRLITAIHYNTRIVFVLLFLTHADYTKNRWEKKL